jgi:hypothetical protein
MAHVDLNAFEALLNTSRVEPSPEEICRDDTLIAVPAPPHHTNEGTNDNSATTVRSIDSTLDMTGGTLSTIVYRVYNDEHVDCTSLLAPPSPLLRSPNTY